MKLIGVVSLDSCPEVKKALLRSQKTVALVGAGISTSSGIPDFRGAAGLYNQKGVSMADIFNADTAFRSEEACSQFYTFMAAMSRDVEKATPTPTHHFLKLLEERQTLLRVYSQNIDYLEGRAGITKTLQLHGTLERVRCHLPSCHFIAPLTEEIRDVFASGRAPPCPECASFNLIRQAEGKRLRPAGSLRPQLVLYNEVHPEGELIATSINKDSRQRPDLLLIMGTSLKIPGCHELIKTIGAAVRKQGGLVVLVNATLLPASKWDHLIDYQIVGTTDDFAAHFTALMSSEPPPTEHHLRELAPDNLAEKRPKLDVMV